MGIGWALNRSKLTVQLDNVIIDCINLQEPRAKIKAVKVIKKQSYLLD